MAGNSLLSHAETPGLGSKAADWFKKGAKGDITGMNPGQGALVVNKDGGQIDAITASTITTRAFLKAVNNAYAAYSGQNVDGASGATQQVSETVAENATACDAQCEGVRIQVSGIHRPRERRDGAPVHSGASGL